MKISIKQIDLYISKPKAEKKVDCRMHPYSQHNSQIMSSVNA